MRTYQEQVKAFREISIDQVQEKMGAEDDFTLYIGRESCPFCQRFVKKLSPLARENQLMIYYLDTDNYENHAEIQAFRESYAIPTVPGLLRKVKEQVQVRCDSSMTSDDILQFIHALN